MTTLSLEPSTLGLSQGLGLVLSHPGPLLSKLSSLRGSVQNRKGWNWGRRALIGDLGGLESGPGSVTSWSCKLCGIGNTIRQCSQPRSFSNSCIVRQAGQEISPFYRWRNRGLLGSGLPEAAIPSGPELFFTVRGTLKCAPSTRPSSLTVLGAPVSYQRPWLGWQPACLLLMLRYPHSWAVTGIPGWGHPEGFRLADTSGAWLSGKHQEAKNFLSSPATGEQGVWEKQEWARVHWLIRGKLSEQQDWKTSGQKVKLDFCLSFDIS